MPPRGSCLTSPGDARSQAGQPAAPECAEAGCTTGTAPHMLPPALSVVWREPPLHKQRGKHARGGCAVVPPLQQAAQVILLQGRKHGRSEFDRGPWEDLPAD